MIEVDNCFLLGSHLESVVCGVHRILNMLILRKHVLIFSSIEIDFLLIKKIKSRGAV